MKDKIANYKDYDKIKRTRDKLNILKIDKQLMYLSRSEELYKVYNQLMATINLF